MVVDEVVRNSVLGSNVVFGAYVGCGSNVVSGSNVVLISVAISVSVTQKCLEDEGNSTALRTTSEQLF